MTKDFLNASKLCLWKKELFVKLVQTFIDILTNPLFFSSKIYRVPADLSRKPL